MSEVETVCPGIIQIFGFCRKRTEDVSHKILGNSVVASQINVNREWGLSLLYVDFVQISQFDLFVLNPR